MKPLAGGEKRPGGPGDQRNRGTSGTIFCASQIEEIFEVHWLDLGMPAAVWGFKVKRMGPLIVGMDSHGGNLLDERTAQVDVSLSRIFGELGIDPDHKYIWWP